MTDTGSQTPAPAPHRLARSAVFLAVIAGVLTICLLALGTWQVQRLFWKLDLIARVDARVKAEPVAPPGPSEWASLASLNDTDAAPDYEYRHVRLSGTFLHQAEVQVYASTELGPGYWVMTPLRQPDSTVVFINRGFVPVEKRAPAARPGSETGGIVTITGLMRRPEISGGFLRPNDTANDRWYSRDVVEMGRTRGLDAIAPYFIDADSTANPGGYPVGGLTRIVFTNNHLVYAITWYVLAAMMAGAGAYVLRRGGDERDD